MYTICKTIKAGMHVVNFSAALLGQTTSNTQPERREARQSDIYQNLFY